MKGDVKLFKLWFCSGAGFSFLFCWLLMIVVILLFLVGGNMYTLVCKPWNNGKLLKVATHIQIPATHMYWTYKDATGGVLNILIFLLLLSTVY